MYKELLAALIKDTTYASLQEPCSEGKIAEAEKVIGFPFPKELKDLLRETDGDNWLLLSAEQIIHHAETNREIFPQYLEPEEFIVKIDRHIFFATNGCGDYYCYRILPDGQADTSAIYIWEHELFETRPVARDMTEFITRYYHSEI